MVEGEKTKDAMEVSNRNRKGYLKQISHKIYHIEITFSVKLDIIFKYFTYFCGIN